ncbi:MAG: T9SS type B sorting domain-containing protein [Flavobacterium sp.]|nr:MAG: T9SS type B sorting domain-containing protein [Flavobacterium sp.]
MNNYKNIFIWLFTCCSFIKMNSQNIVVDDTKSASELVQNVLINSSCINIENVSASGNPTATKSSYASFSSGTSNFPFTNGLVLATSPAKNAEGPYDEAASEGERNMSWNGDSDLNNALGNATSTQATVLEFDFVSLTNAISFNYIFASNEYQWYYPCEYSDGFAFLIKESGSTEPYKNLAVLPNTTIPVSSTTVHPKIDPVIVRGQKYSCDATNENYFNGYNTEESPINYAGQTIALNAKAEVIPNKKYHLKLVIADDITREYNSAVFIEAGSFLSTVDFGEDRTIANNNPACYGENVILDTKLDPAVNSFKWFKKNASNNYIEIPAETSSIYNAKTTGDYKVEVTLSGTSCIAKGEIKIEFAPEILYTNTTILQCDDNTDGISIFNLTKVAGIVKNNISEIVNNGYYESFADAEAKTNKIVTPEKYTNKIVNQIVFARIENKYGCFKIAEITLQISNTSLSSQNPMPTCDGDNVQDGIHEFDFNSEITPRITGVLNGVVINYYLTTNDALTETNPLPNIFKNTTPFSQIIYARATNGADCYGITPITLVINTFDPPNFEDETKYLCKGSAVDLTVDPTFSKYLWTTGYAGNSITVLNPGDYTVTVTDANGCEKTKAFKVILSEPAVITDVVVKDFSANENTVLIQYTGVGNYQFSLDGIVFQNEPLFTAVPPGIYNVIARDKNGCGLSNSFMTYVLDYPRFFTPNGDGFNDLWYIKNIDELPDYTISVFDRYGKLVKQMNQNSPGWNGQFNGQLLPSDDYWFTLLFVNGRNVKGHFSLKR